MIQAFVLAATVTLDKIASRPELAHGIISGEVYDLDTHKVLWRRNGGMLMEAASTTKLVTFGTTMALLGPNYRITTPVYADGTIDTGGTLHGDLTLVANGDANLSQRIQPNGTLAFENEDHSYDGGRDTRAVPGDPLAVLHDLAAQVAKAGVKSVDGRVTIDTSLFPDQGPEAGTGAVLSPIVVNDNLVDVTVTPGAAPGAPVTIAVSPQTPYVNFVVKATTSATDAEPTIDLSDDKTNGDGSHTVTVTGTQPMGNPMLYAYRVPEPARFAHDAFVLALHDGGVTVVEPPANAPHNGRVSEKRTLVAQHVALALAQDMRVTLKVSDNLHASLQPYLWAAHANEKVTLQNGFDLERGVLERAHLDLDGASQQDGLGGFAAFSPDFMVNFLSWAYKQSWYPQYLHALPILGKDGTLYNIQNNSEAVGKVFAKTGTWGSNNLLRRGELVTKGLAGYTTSKRGHHLAFAFWINRMYGHNSVDPNKDGAHHAGELLGEMAATAYTDY